MASPGYGGGGGGDVGVSTEDDLPSASARYRSPQFSGFRVLCVRLPNIHKKGTSVADKAATNTIASAPLHRSRSPVITSKA